MHQGAVFALKLFQATQDDAYLKRRKRVYTNGLKRIWKIQKRSFIL